MEMENLHNTHHTKVESFHKSKGQHILKNLLLVDNIVQKFGNNPTNVVFEIGLGTSNLTKKLLDAGKKVIVVEIDPRMVLELQKRFQGTPSSRLMVWFSDSFSKNLYVCLILIELC
jgi:18S rRNA (adenine1779-N6/adenine1780-N6)-dimethyltransferase